MAAYMVKAPTPIERMEGDDSEIEILVPTAFDMAGRTVRMQVRSTTGDLLFAKSTTTGGGITLAGQMIKITILPADTLHKHGSHLWEMEVQNEADGIVTIANGPFKIRRQTCIV